MVMRDRSSPAPRGFVARLADWLGRAHPMIVHFPLALFPMALLALVLSRRAPEWMIAARFMVVAAGITALPAALLGWFAGGWPSPGNEFTLEVHRWLGVGIAMAGLALALLVARRRGALPWAWSFAALLVINIALVAQGWFGGALVHGADHLSW